jgi:hypothetical protein
MGTTRDGGQCWVVVWQEKRLFDRRGISSKDRLVVLFSGLEASRDRG